MTHISVLTNATLIAFQSSWMETHFFGKLLWVKDYPNTPDSMNYALLAVRLLFIFFYEVGLGLQNDSWQKKKKKGQPIRRHTEYTSLRFYYSFNHIARRLLAQDRHCQLGHGHAPDSEAGD